MTNVDFRPFELWTKEVVHLIKKVVDVSDIFSMYCTGIMNAEAEAYSEMGAGGWSLGAYGVLDFQEGRQGIVESTVQIVRFLI